MDSRNIDELKKVFDHVGQMKEGIGAQEHDGVLNEHYKGSFYQARKKQLANETQAKAAAIVAYHFCSLQSQCPFGKECQKCADYLYNTSLNSDNRARARSRMDKCILDGKSIICPNAFRAGRLSQQDWIVQQLPEPKPIETKEPIEYKPYHYDDTTLSARRRGRPRMRIPESDPIDGQQTFF